MMPDGGSRPGPSPCRRFSRAGFRPAGDPCPCLDPLDRRGAADHRVPPRHLVTRLPPQALAVARRVRESGGARRPPGGCSLPGSGGGARLLRGAPHPIPGCHGSREKGGEGLRCLPAPRTRLGQHRAAGHLHHRQRRDHPASVRGAGAVAEDADRSDPSDPGWTAWSSGRVSAVRAGLYGQPCSRSPKNSTKMARSFPSTTPSPLRSHSGL